MDSSKDYDALIRGTPEGTDIQTLCSIRTDWFLLNGLSKLINNKLYEPRTFVSTKTKGKPDWNNSNYQAGFTGLDNAVADEQTEVRVMHDDENLYFRLRTFGNSKNDFYDIMTGDKRFKIAYDLLEIDI